MKCCRCPLYQYWSNESDRGESCAIFGDGWDSPFQYEDKEGTTIGCYLDRHFIEKADAERDEYYASMAESMAQDLWNTADIPQTDSEIKRNSLRPDCNGCRFVGTYDTEFPCANCTRKNKDYYDADQTDCPWR